MKTLELKVPPLVLVLLTGAAMWLASSASPALAWHPPYRLAVATALGLAGIAVAALGVAAFRRARTTVDPTKPQRAKSLVRGSVYRLSRNPMYLGFLLALLGFAVFLGNLLALVFVPLFVLYMNRFQIAPEERVLAAMFGPEFVAYCREVRRWL
jgi:protein-S-isoprenylcysteine O-methyltransferase Ste14